MALMAGFGNHVVANTQERMHSLLRARLLRLLDLQHLLQHVFIRRTHFVIHFDKLPPHDALAINHVGRRVRNRALRFFIEQAVTINHAVVGIRKQGKIQTMFIFDFVEHLLRFVVRVNADSKDFDLGFGRFFEQ